MPFMSEHESEFIKEFKLAVIRGLVGFSGIVIIGITIFYFTISFRVQNLETTSERLDRNKADKGVMESELKAINSSLIRIENKLDK